MGQESSPAASNRAISTSGCRTRASHRCRVHADRAQPHADRRGQGRRPQDHRHERLPLPHARGRCARTSCCASARARRSTTPTACALERQFYMKTEEEMREALKGLPEACDTTVEVAEKVNVVLGATPSFRVFPLPEGETGFFSASACRRAWSSTTAIPFPQEAQGARRLRDGHHHPARASGVLPHRAGVHRWGAQPGHQRGSGPWFGRRRHRGVRHGHPALDPLSNGLLFERFLSPRREIPDIDVDFEQGRRER